jgi:hypothetical protein
MLSCFTAGIADLDVTNIDLGAGTSADFAITSGPGSITLVPGANVAMEITYRPSDGGTDSGTLVIASDDADEPVVTVSLSGNGVAVPVPEIDVSPMSLTYGDVYIGSTSSQTVTITNTGTADLDVTSIALGTGTSADFAITSGPGSTILVPGSNVAVEVTYSPSDGGTDSGTLVIASDDADEPVVTVSLSGNGVAVPVPEIDVTPLSVNYGDVYVGSTSADTVTISNIGSADLEVTDISLTGSADFVIIVAPLTPAIIIPGASVEIEITYSPTDTGFDSGTLVIESDDADEPVTSVSLSGDGIPATIPQPELCPDEYRWSIYHMPNFEWDGNLFRSWIDVRFVNSGSGDAFNVTATITYAPANVTIVDGDVTLGDIPAGDGAWSEDFFELEIDTTNPQDPDEGILWQVEYDDAAGVHHVIEDLPEFCEFD